MKKPFVYPALALTLLTLFCGPAFAAESGLLTPDSRKAFADDVSNGCQKLIQTDAGFRERHLRASDAMTICQCVGTSYSNLLTEDYVRKLSHMTDEQVAADRTQAALMNAAQAACKPVMEDVIKERMSR